MNYRITTPTKPLIWAGLYKFANAVDPWLENTWWPNP
jgi:hypothetical protein